MPLLFEQQKLEHSLFNQNNLLTAVPPLASKFKNLAKDWTPKPEKTLTENVLYVSQREYAVIDPQSKGDVEYIATDSATTCHIVVLIQPETKVIGLSHFDGCNTAQGARDLLTSMDSRCSLSKADGDVAQHSYDVYIFGGFNDEKGTSNDLSRELLGELHKCSQHLHIKVLCIGELNSHYKRSVCYPIYYGAGVNCETLEVSRVQCADKGPLTQVKGARNFVGPKEMQSCYDNVTREMVVEPFSFSQPFEQVEIWLQQKDSFLLQHLSTSPKQEPVDFISGVRQSLMFIALNPNPMDSIFKNNKTPRFKLSEGHWKDVA